MSDGFDILRDLLRTRAGWSLGADKLYLARTRLAPVCRDMGIETLDALCERLRAETPGSPLEGAVLAAMAIHETSFFRDRRHYDILAGTVIPRLVAARSSSRTLRIWCAACSTGQEPYSLALMLAEMTDRLRGWRVEIVATDISPVAIERARAGRYSALEVQRGLPIRALIGHFTQAAEGWRISGRLRASVEFRVANLLDDLGDLGAFDLVLCRNVLIYMEASARLRLLRSVVGHLAADGVLLLGATETVLELEDLALAPSADGAAFYRRAGATAESPAGFAPADLP